MRAPALPMPMTDVKAPCGHPGIPVVGAYYRCAQGCSKDPHVKPQAPAAKRRAQTGHADMCGCKPCTVRRRGTAVVVRTKDGQEARIPWNGTDDHQEWKSTIKGHIRHWKIVDDDGKTVDEGTMFTKSKDEEVQVGDILDLDFFKPTTKLASTLTLTKTRGYRGLRFTDLPAPSARELDYWRQIPRTPRQAAKNASFAYSPQFNQRPPKDRRQSSMRDNFGYPLATLDHLRFLVEACGATDAEIREENGYVNIYVRETHAASAKEEEQIADSIRQKCREHMAAGVAFRVYLETPTQSIQRAVERVSWLVRDRWVSDTDIKGYIENMLAKDFGVAANTSKLLVQVHYNNGYQIEVSYECCAGHIKRYACRIAY